MGLRFYRRTNLSHGLGLNFSKKGVSWSIRTKYGSFGPKGYSIKTGIKGLTYQKRYKKSSNTHSNRSKKNRYSNSALPIQNYSLHNIKDIRKHFFITIAFIIVVIEFGFLAAIIIFSIYAFFIDFNNKKNNVQDKSEPNILNNHVIDDNNEFVANAKSNSKNSYESVLTNAQLITLENLCQELKFIAENLYLENPLDPKLVNQAKINRPQILYHMYILHDICNIFYYLRIFISDDNLEKNIWFGSILWFLNNTSEYKTENEGEIIKTIQYLYEPDFFVFKDVDKNPFSLLILLSKEKSKYLSDYKLAMLNYVAFVTTIDISSSMNIKRKELFERINLY
jgi:hypothetical protein